MFGNNAVLFSLAQVPGQQEVYRESEEWQDNCPTPYTPTPVDVCKKFLSRSRAGERGYESGRGSKGESQTTIAQVRHIGCKDIPGIC